MPTGTGFPLFKHMKSVYNTLLPGDFLWADYSISPTRASPSTAVIRTPRRQL